MLRPFKKRKAGFVLAAIFSVMAYPSSSEIAFIANPSVAVSELSREDVTRIFLINKTSLQGIGRVEPVLEKSGLAHEVFLRTYMGRSDSALMTYYRSLLFTGRGSVPKSFGSESEIVDYVARTRGAIGYVQAASATSAVRILKVK